MTGDAEYWKRPVKPEKNTYRKKFEKGIKPIDIVGDWVYTSLCQSDKQERNTEMKASYFTTSCMCMMMCGCILQGSRSDRGSGNAAFRRA